MIPVLMAEDEKYAGEHLRMLLHQIAPELQVMTIVETVTDAVAWLKQHPVSLLLLDIHLADDVSFRIFETLKIDTPVIFTTAYDQYAIQAFKVNGIDYLLKPIDQEALAQAISRFRKQHTQSVTAQVAQMLQQWKPTTAKNYRQRFLVHSRQQLLSISTDQIAYFEGEDRYVHLVLFNGQRHLIDDTLNTLEQELEPREFMRVNRSFIVHNKSINAIQILGKSRLQLVIQPLPKREVLVSAAQAGDVKDWLGR